MITPGAIPATIQLNGDILPALKRRASCSALATSSGDEESRIQLWLYRDDSTEGRCCQDSLEKRDTPALTRLVVYQEVGGVRPAVRIDG